jgi:DNA-binding CsgD family transcriptional regulator
MTPPLTPHILSLSDTGHTPASIATLLDLSLSTVYATLRAHRPQRARAPRPRTSDLPRRIQGLASRGHKPARIAVLLDVSRAYVYRWLLPPPPY